MISSSIKVWDLFIRFFHWKLVVAFLTSYLTKVEGEGETNLHF
jgi:cytochrome b